MTVFAVSCIDIGDSCDGKPRVLKIFQTRQRAKNYVKKDMDNVKSSSHYDIVNYDKMYLYENDSFQHGCEWNIEEIALEFDVIDRSLIKEIMNKYFEYDIDTNKPNKNYDETYSAQDCIDDILELM
jgi:hypothetical protein